MIYKVIIASALLAICLFTLSASPQKPQQWEYKFEYQCDEKKANKLAGDGWELVTMGVSAAGLVNVIHCVFKRPKV